MIKPIGWQAGRCELPTSSKHVAKAIGAVVTAPVGPLRCFRYPSEKSAMFCICSFAVRRTAAYGLAALLTSAGISLIVASGLATGADTDAAGERQRLTELLRSDASVFEQAKACQRLAIIGDESSVDAIAPLLDHPQLSVYARMALEQIPGSAADEALRKAVQKVRAAPADGSDDAAQRERLLIGLVHSLGRRSADSAVPLIGEIAEDTDLPAAVRQLAAGVLERGHDVADPIAARAAEADLASLLVSADASQFRHALHVARQRGGDALGAVIDQLPSMDPARQSAALRWLADYGDDAVVDKVEPLTKAQADDVAATAWETIGALEGFEDSADRSTDRREAAFAAAHARPAIASRVMTALAGAKQGDVDDEVRKQIAEAADDKSRLEPPVLIGLVDYAETARLEPLTQPILRIAGSHEDPAVVSASLRAAGSLAGANELAELMRVADAAAQRFPSGEINTAADEAVQRAMVRIAPGQVAEVIGEQLAAARGGRKQKLMEHLAFVGGDKALSIVAAAARGGDLAEVDLATRVLGQWLSTDAADVLGDLAEELRHPTYRMRALRGYLRIGRQFDMPDKERVQLAARAHALAPRPEERTAALEILSRYPAIEGVQWLAKQSAADAVIAAPEKRVIQQTLIQVARRVAEDQPQQVAEALSDLDSSMFPEPLRGELDELKRP